MASVIQTQRIELRPAWTSAVLLATGHAAAFVYCVYAYPPMIKMLVGILIVYCGWTSVWHRALLGTMEAVHLIDMGENTCTLHTRHGESVEARVADSSRVLAFLLVIALQSNGRKRLRTLMVPRDAVSRDEFRRLRVWLRWSPRDAPACDGK